MRCALRPWRLTLLFVFQSGYLFVVRCRSVLVGKELDILAKIVLDGGLNTIK